MYSNPINFLYNLDHVTLWRVEVGPVANAREGSMQEHDWASLDCQDTMVSSMLILEFSMTYLPLFFLRQTDWPT